MYWTPERKTAAKAFIINSMVEELQSLRTICRDNPREVVPNISTVMEWLAADRAFAEHYGRASLLRTEGLLEETIEIADDDSDDVVDGPRGSKFNKEFAARSRIRIDARLKYAEKTQPKKYGVKIDHTTDGEKINQTIKVGYGKKDLDSYEDLL